MKNKARSTDTRSVKAIVCIFGVVAVIGLLAYFIVIRPNEVAAPAKVADQKDKVNELESAGRTVKGFMEAMMIGKKNALLPYVYEGASEEVGKWPDDLGSLNLHLGKFEIRASEKIDEEKFKFTVREYQEHKDNGMVGYSDNGYSLKKVDSKYQISAIEEGAYTVAIEIEKWKALRNEEKGYEYRYPDNFFFQEPEISVARMASGSSLDGCYTRNFGGFTVKKVKIGETSYCLTESTEGAAGSIYVDSSYTNVEGDRIITLHFIVRHADCGVFGAKKELRSVDCERFNSSGPRMTEKTVETFKIIP